LKQETVNLVQKSWKKVAAIAPQAAELFYHNLFASDPSLKALFKGDMQEQGKKLMHMIGAAVGKLNEVETLVPMLQGLAKRHGGYGVQEAHYHTVGAALLQTLGQGLDADFTPAVKDAWASVYSVMVEVMVAAQSPEPNKSFQPTPVPCSAEFHR
jgi:methyl-accepting chemotaxis protein